MDKNTSLVVHKKGILQKIHDFLRKIFKHKQVEEQIEIVQPQKIEEKNKENFIYNLKKNANSDIKELINKIQNGEVNLEEKDDAELEEIEKRLSEYLEYLESAIREKKEEIEKVEQTVKASIIY